MSHLITGPGLGLGQSQAYGQSATLPIIDLVNPSTQSVNNSGNITFDAWTVFIKFEDTGAPASTQKLWDLDLDGNDDAFLHYLSNGNLQLSIYSGGVAKSYVFAASDYLLGQGDATITIAAQEDDMVIAINGIIMCVVDSVSMPVGTPDGVGIGQNHSGTQSFAASIKAFKFYNQRLPDYRVIELGRHRDFGVSYSYDPDRLVHFKLGQSNSVGTQATAPDPSAYTNLSRMQIIEKNGALDSTYQDPSCSNGTGGALFSIFQQNGNFSSGGVEIDAIATANSGKDVAVMHIDRGNTGLIENTGNFRWLPWDNSTANQSVLRAPAYQATLMQIIGALHGRPHSRTWWQGELDASDATITQVQYRNELVALLALFDRYVGVPTVVVGLHDAPSSGYANWASIQAAQAEINSYYGNAYHVSAAGASTVVDEVHLDQAGYQSVGADIAAQINAVT